MAGPKDEGGGEDAGRGPRDHVDARDDPRAAARAPDTSMHRPRVRPPAVAGMFYPAQRDACLTEARDLMQRGARAAAEHSRDAEREDGRPVRDGTLQASPLRDAPRREAPLHESPVRDAPVRGAIVPHAGWICSGAIAAESIAAIDRRATATKPDLVVVFGAVHTPLEIEYAALDTHAIWAEPFEQSRVAEEVRAKLIEASRGDELFRVDDRFHRREHAVEVELPLIEVAWPGAAILPIEVPTVDRAARIGAATARQVIAAGFRSPVFLASSDLTHYGPAYGFAPGGAGLSGLAWAGDNDRRLLDLVERYDVERIVPEVRQRANACGGGAIAAMLAACRELGASRARLLRHANSYETLSAAGVRVGHDATDNAVGYASVIVW